MVLSAKLRVGYREAAVNETDAGPAPWALMLAGLAPVLILYDETVLGPYSLEEITPFTVFHLQ